MRRVVDELPRGAHLLLVRLRSLGDCVLTTPAIELLKQYRPDLAIGVMVEDRFASVYHGNPAVDRILPPSKRAAAGFAPALTLNLHGGARSAALTVASLARWRAGFRHYRFGAIYNVPIPRAQEILGEERTVHTAEHVASAMFFLGVPPSEIPRARLYAKATARRSGYAVVHPFASRPDKAWPAERFAELCARLRNEMDVVVIGAAGDDFDAFAPFECWRGAPLEDVKSLLSGAALFAGNDSGPAHMAAAFGVPVTVLYGVSDPAVWAPWRTRSESIVRIGGLDRVPVDEVWERIVRLREARV